jgi:hypothetical protein
MEKRALFLIDYANRPGPVTVRQLYYRAEISRLPGIDKTEGSYNKVQRQVPALRRAQRLPYRHIADLTRRSASRAPTTASIRHCRRRPAYTAKRCGQAARFMSRCGLRKTPTPAPFIRSPISRIAR